ncbi:hypothetical protein L202_01918 [Cryptococcus amylolentus CBS 6039]|uniref:DNA damage-binding protein CMR1 n=1 Tax=Cryptococcus amylolentus CBS 6039 TaxID=1295533 RepID=A0A1E3I0H2_9TREE|nr:hypothetical protein L202_01918 [Cryptococcus amylolentus CBS 6039]ODN81496.1 hypothetical protein L202_01918 [Cryptococcus amylolentus CBS 6039]
MDDEHNAYEIERQKTIAENRALLDSLGLDPSSRSPFPSSSSPAPTSHPNKSKPSKAKPAAAKKRKAPDSAGPADDDGGPRRRSGRLRGMEADGEEMKVKLEEEEREREVLRVVNRREREQVMGVGSMVEEGTEEGEVKELETFLSYMSALPNPRPYLLGTESDSDAYADSSTTSDDTQRLREAFSDMSLKANVKVTNERVFSMCVHPEKRKTIVFVGDKYGGLGIWDALGPAAAKAENDDDTNGVKDEEESQEGRVWRIQAHAKNSISCMKVDPISGSGLFTSAYDCSLRHLDFCSLQSTELFRLPDEDLLINHFDLVPSGQEAWMVDKNGGLSHCDFRQKSSQSGRKRWVLQDEGRGAKLGGVSVNPAMPHLICTAGNDQHVRIWDTRLLADIPFAATTIDDSKPPTPPPSALLRTEPVGVSDYDAVSTFMGTKPGKGLMRGKWQHGKSCSSAYWDPWGRRLLTTSYDDTLRIFNLSPSTLSSPTPIPSSLLKPTKSIRHNCQTGRWLTILRAQWSASLSAPPHFTVGNMKRTLDVVSGVSGERVVSLWAEGVTAVPTVTASHPGVVDRVVGGNTSGRVQLWSSGDGIYEQ